MTTGFRSPEVFTLPTAQQGYDVREEQTMRRSVELALQQLRADVQNVSRNNVISADGGPDGGSLQVGDFRLFPFAGPIETPGDSDPTFQPVKDGERMILRVMPKGPTPGLCQFEFFGRDYYDDPANWSNWKIVASTGFGAYSFETDGVGTYAPGNPMVFQVGGAATNPNQLLLDASGNVGVGDATLQSKLHVAGQVRSKSNVPAFLLDDTDTGALHRFAAGNNSVFYDQDSGNQGLSGSHIWRISDVQEMELDANGRLGVGTGTPVYRVDVLTNASSGSGGMRVNTTGQSGQTIAQFTSTNANVYFDFAGAGSHYLDSINSTFFRRRSDNAITMEVDHNLQRVGIGTTSPDQPLEVAGNLGGYGIHVNSTTGAGIELDRGTSSNAHGVLLQTAGVDNWFIGNFNETGLRFKTGGFAGTTRMVVDDTSGAVTIADLGGVGTRYLGADSSGTLVEKPVTYLVPIWAEENAALTAATTYQWAFGNGANTPSTNGIMIHVPSGETCEVVAMALVSSAAITATVELVQNGTPLGSQAQISLSAASALKVTFGTPYSLTDGDIINFRTLSADGTNTGTPNQVVAWLQYTKS